MTPGPMLVALRRWLGRRGPGPRPAIRIAVVHRRQAPGGLVEHGADVIWPKRIAEALARRGHVVDLVSGADGRARSLGERLRGVPFDAAAWASYDVVWTFLHRSFADLLTSRGAAQPCVVASLGSLVGPEDEPGVHFHGAERAWLHAIQARARSRAVVVLTEPSRALWQRQHGERPRAYRIPMGTDRIVPGPGADPYVALGEPVAVYIGGLAGGSQKATNLLWQARLNAIGRLLRSYGLRLCVVGKGDTDRLDRDVVTVFGPVDKARIWDYQYFAAVGLVLAQGPVQHNESTKLYYYLRTGLPVVSEGPVPNNDVLEAARLGAIVPYGDDAELARRAAEVVRRPWDRERAIRYVLEHHTWDARAASYEEALVRELAGSRGR